MFARPQATSAVVIGSLLTLPLVIAAVSLFGIPWAHVFDMAIVEERVRDVFTAHPPVLGLPGRLGSPENPPRHPGALAFFLLAPVYRVLGASAWALQASTLLLHIAAVATALALIRRRGGNAHAIALGMGLGVLMLGYGFDLFVNPWTPFWPVLWFVVFLVALWSLLRGDNAVLPIAAATATLCAQTHISYLAMCGGLGVFATALVASRFATAGRGSKERRLLVRSLAFAAAVILILWLPPLVEELLGAPGNMTALVRSFRDPPSEPLGYLRALPILFSHLDPWYLLIEQARAPGGLEKALADPSPEAWRGAVALLAWVTCAGAAIRLRDRGLSSLHALIAAGLCVGLFAISRVFGSPWTYLFLWGWSFGVFAIVACVTTLALYAWRVTWWRERLGKIPPWLGVAFVAACALRLASTCTDIRPRSHRLSVQLGVMMPSVVAAIEAHTGASTGRAGRYLVTWSDAYYGGSQGFGLLNALESAGYRAGAEPRLDLMVGSHHTMDPSRATARIHFANAAWVRYWQRVPGALRVTMADVRTPEQRDEYDRLHADITRALLDTGRPDLARSLDYAAPVDVSPILSMAVNRLLEISPPAAVFIVPMSVRPRVR